VALYGRRNRAASMHRPRGVCQTSYFPVAVPESGSVVGWLGNLLLLLVDSFTQCFQLVLQLTGPAEPLLVAVVWPIAQPRGQHHETIFLSISLSLFSSAFRSCRPSVIIPVPCSLATQEPNLWLELACQFHTIIAYLYYLCTRKCNSSRCGTSKFGRKWGHKS